MAQPLSELAVHSLNEMEIYMALRDSFNKIISYFDTDEVSEVEEPAVASVKRQQDAAQPASQQQKLKVTNTTNQPPDQVSSKYSLDRIVVLRGKYSFTSNTSPIS